MTLDPGTLAEIEARRGVQASTPKPTAKHRQASASLPLSISEVASPAAVLGAMGGKARASRLTPERMSEIGRMGSDARWHRT